MKKKLPFYIWISFARIEKDCSELYCGIGNKLQFSPFFSLFRLHYYCAIHRYLYEMKIKNVISLMSIDLLTFFEFLSVIAIHYHLQVEAESNRERVGFGPLLITVLFLALKKLVFLKKKNSSPKKNFFTFFLCNFSVRTLQCFQKFFF